MCAGKRCWVLRSSSKRDHEQRCCGKGKEDASYPTSRIDGDQPRSDHGGGWEVLRYPHKSRGQVFTLDNLSFLSYVFLPWLAHYGSSMTERCTMSLLGEMRARRFLGTLPTASRFSLLFSKWPGAFIGSVTP